MSSITIRTVAQVLTATEQAGQYQERDAIMIKFGSFEVDGAGLFVIVFIVIVIAATISELVPQLICK